MNGWLVLALIGVSATFLLWLAGVARALWSAVGAAMMLGAAGYALQGHASLPERPAAANVETMTVDPAIVALRESLLGRFTGDGAYLVASDALMRSGSRRSGANVVLLGLNHYPRSLTLWTGLGSALAQHDGTLSPAARLAFDQAIRLAPDHPAAYFFRGLASVQSGDFAAARPDWARALALSPAGASYRREIALRLYALDIAIAQEAAQPTK